MKRSTKPFVERIISGGQAGVDRGALDAAIEVGIPHGGWCPRGRKAEDGAIDAQYQLRETDSSDYAVRTAWNVRDSDGTLIICRGEPTGGTELTKRLADRDGKPCLIADPDNPRSAATIRRWLADHQIATVNVAGPRESGCPGIADAARRLLVAVLKGSRKRESTKRSRTGSRLGGTS